MIKQILNKDNGVILGVSDNGELYELVSISRDSSGYTNGWKWSHICSSPDDKEKPYFDGEWKTRNSSN